MQRANNFQNHDTVGASRTIPLLFWRASCSQVQVLGQESACCEVKAKQGWGELLLSSTACPAEECNLQPVELSFS